MKWHKRHQSHIKELRRRIRVWRSQKSGSEPSISASDDSFVIARIIGNDLYPRHGSGTMLANLRFILENEPHHPKARRLFVLNRLFDPDQQAEAISLIEEAGDAFSIIPFRAEEFSALGWNIDAFGGTDYFNTTEFHETDGWRQDLIRVWAAAPKVAYAINVNGARNHAIDLGRDRATWTAVLDGSCAFTEKSFQAFADTCTDAPFAPYAIVPMNRVEHNSQYFEREPRLDSKEEPQVAFHASSRLRFDERFVYGIRNKTNLLRALGCPGAWDHWAPIDWLPPEPLQHADRFFYKYSAGGVFRLSSGGHGLEEQTAHKTRHRARTRSILVTISRLCQDYGTLEPDLAPLILGEDATGDVEG